MQNKELNEKIEYKNIRFNPEITEFEALAKKMAKAYGYTANLSINQNLTQLLRLRVAQKNECAYCVILHSKAARDLGILDGKIDGISSWWNSNLFTEQEKAALSYCDVLSEGSHKNFQTYHDKLSDFLDEQQIAEVAAIVINMNVWTRLKLAQGQIPYIG